MAPARPPVDVDRRRLAWRPVVLGTVAALATLGSLAAPFEARDIPGPTGPVRSVLSVGMTVGDLDRALAFYTGVLGFETEGQAELSGDWFERLHGIFGARARVARLRLGREVLELTEYLAPRGRLYPADTRSHDHWFQHVAIIVADMDRAYETLRRHGVAHASTGPQRLPDWNPNAGGIRAFYFRDPDGHFLEILQFPPGKGEARWQRADGRLFLGIDHTAIVTSDTGRALAFYRDALGLSVAGESENFGAEQEHLNNVFGARLRITTLRAAAGPGIELLDYLAPRGGRPAPADLAANDVAHWQTTVGLARLAASWLRPRGFFLVSPDIVPVPGTASAFFAFDRGLLVRDPDGHGVRLVE
jgi:catechol 2,3-dioxygenase-like lactoylglutathione lyase family enzyme